MRARSSWTISRGMERTLLEYKVTIEREARATVGRLAPDGRAAAREQPRDGGVQQRDAEVVKARTGLIEEYQLRVAQEGHRDAYALALSHREPVDAVTRDLA